LLKRAELGEDIPFFNKALVEAQIGDIENARLASRSSIRDAFGKRRKITSASFVEALVAQSEKEFATSKAAIRGFENEKATQRTFQAIAFEFQEANIEMERELEQLRIVSNVAGLTQQLGQQQAQFEQELAAIEAREAGKFFGAIGQSFIGNKGIDLGNFGGILGSTPTAGGGGAATTGGGFISDQAAALRGIPPSAFRG
jgi:hypothetical protein